LIVRQSGASNGVVMPKPQSSSRCHGIGKCSTAGCDPLSRRRANGGKALADQGLVRETACAIVDKLKRDQVTPLDLLDVLEKRIEQVDGQVNALPILCFDRARTHARALMQKKPSDRGLLAGLPMPIKD